MSRGPTQRRPRAMLLLGAMALPIVIASGLPARADEPPRGANPRASFERPPALGFAMKPGAPVDASGFARRMELRVPPSPDGALRLRLPPAVLAAARPDLGDIRVVDGAGRQWPYLLEEGQERERVELRIEPSTAIRGRSRYELLPEASPIAIESILLDIQADYLDRRFRVLGKYLDGREETLRVGVLARRPGEPVAPIPVVFSRSRVASLSLLVEDGDDAPIDLRGARAVTPTHDLFLVAPEGAYTLLVGQPGASPPRYELAGERDLVVSVKKAPIEAGQLEGNPAFAPPPTPTTTPTTPTTPESSQHILWAVLALAVVTLGALTLKLARREIKEPQKAPDDSPPRPENGGA